MSVHHNNVISVSACVLERGERDREEGKREKEQIGNEIKRI